MSPDEQKNIAPRNYLPLLAVHVCTRLKHIGGSTRLSLLSPPFYDLCSCQFSNLLQPFYYSSNIKVNPPSRAMSRWRFVCHQSDLICDENYGHLDYVEYLLSYKTKTAAILIIILIWNNDQVVDLCQQPTVCQNCGCGGGVREIIEDEVQLRLFWSFWAFFRFGRLKRDWHRGLTTRWTTDLGGLFRYFHWWI